MHRESVSRGGGGGGAQAGFFLEGSGWISSLELVFTLSSVGTGEMLQHQSCSAA